MRIFTDNDKRGLLIALRVFLRNLNGERLSQASGIPLIEKALDAGLSVDELLNKGNYGRAVEVQPELTFAEYVDILCDRRIEVKGIKDEPMWHDTANGFGIIAEAAHDFFMEVSGKGGKWNIPSALVNLAKAIRAYSLQAVLSETLIKEVIGDNPEMTYFNYILAIVKDFNSLSIDNEPTEAQLNRQKEEEEFIRTNVEDPVHEDESPEKRNEGPEQGDGAEEPEPEEEYTDERPEDEPFPPEEEYIPEGFESVVVTQQSPADIKKNCLRTVLGNYSVNELLGLVKTIKDGMDIPVDEVLNRLANGRFEPKLEDAATQKIHQEINADLILSFISCVRVQGREMDEETATEYDILHQNWDLRTPAVRKRHKLLRLILTEGKDDPDLLDAIQDIEKMYLDDEED